MTNRKNVLIVVHGMGSQSRNSSLRNVARPIFDLVKRRGDPNWEQDVHGTLAIDEDAHAAIEFDGKTWEFAEYWWAQEFAPPKTLKIIPWILVRLFWHFWSIARSIWQAIKEILPGNDDPYRARLYHLVAGFVFLLAVPVLMVLSVAALIVISPLGMLSKLPGVPSIVKTLQGALRGVALDYLGDIYVYLHHDVQAVHIRDGFEDLLRMYARQWQVERIVLLAHSTGNMVVYDSLAHLNSHEDEHPDNEKALAKVKAVVGIGSILPMAWNRFILRDEEATRFRRAVPDHVRWYHLWTRYDVGPAGPIKKRIPVGTIDRDNVSDRRVSNAEDLALDHTGYWNNEEQVHTLVLEEMGGLNPGNKFWRGNQSRTSASGKTGWRNRSLEASEDYLMRRRLAVELAFGRLLTYLTLIVSFGYLAWFDDRARTMAEWFWVDDLGHRFGWDKLVEATTATDPSVWTRMGLAGLVALAVFAIVHIGLFQLIYKQLWALRQKRKRTQRDEAFREWRELPRQKQEYRDWDAAGRPEVWH